MAEFEKLSAIEEEVRREKRIQAYLDYIAQNDSKNFSLPVPSAETVKTNEIALGNINTDRVTSNSCLKNKRINLQYENIVLTTKIDQLYSQRILNKGSDLKKNLAFQNKLLDLKGLIPANLEENNEKTLSPEILKKIEELNQNHELNLNTEDLSSLKIQIDSELDKLKYEIQEGFNYLQTENFERMQIFQLAKMTQQRDEKDTMVRNQRS